MGSRHRGLCHGKSRQRQLYGKGGLSQSSLGERERGGGDQCSHSGEDAGAPGEHPCGRPGGNSQPPLETGDKPISSQGGATARLCPGVCRPHSASLSLRAGPHKPGGSELQGVGAGRAHPAPAAPAGSALTPSAQRHTGRSWHPHLRDHESSGPLSGHSAACGQPKDGPRAAAPSQWVHRGSRMLTPTPWAHMPSAPGPTARGISPFACSVERHQPETHMDLEGGGGSNPAQVPEGPDCLRGRLGLQFLNPVSSQAPGPRLFMAQHWSGPHTRWASSHSPSRTTPPCTLCPSPRSTLPSLLHKPIPLANSSSCSGLPQHLAFVQFS